MQNKNCDENQREVQDARLVAEQEVKSKKSLSSKRMRILVGVLFASLFVILGAYFLIMYSGYTIPSAVCIHHWIDDPGIVIGMSIPIDHRCNKPSCPRLSCSNCREKRPPDGRICSRCRLPYTTYWKLKHPCFAKGIGFIDVDKYNKEMEDYSKWTCDCGKPEGGRRIGPHPATVQGTMESRVW